jgi:SAM-dependent methyltransferase
MIASSRTNGAPRPRVSSRLALATLSVAVALAVRALPPPGGETAAPASRLDVPYEPTPPGVVRAMVDLAEVGPGDVVYDLGCGDGRILVEAARRGARAVGVDLDPRRIAEARENARAAGVLDRVELRVGDLFQTDVRPATVVMLFLWPHVNLRLRPRLLAELRPGARVVSHWHDMGDWRPDRKIEVEGRPVYLWRIPARGPAAAVPAGR